MMRRFRTASLMFVLLGAAAAAPAEVTLCTEISSLPFTISAPGVYCLNASLDFPAASGIAISVQSNDVVLDFNGHTLDGSAAGPTTTAQGVAGKNAVNVTVRNGAIRGFGEGVWFGGLFPQNIIVEDMRLDQCTRAGITVRGQGSIARRNLLTRTGGATMDVNGIYALGDGVQVTDNQVVGTLEQPGYQARGINVDSATGAVVEHNVVTNAVYGPTDSIGIRMTGARATVVANRVVNMRKGIVFMYSGTGVYMDNTVGNAAVPFTGGTAAGATNFAF